MNNKDLLLKAQHTHSLEKDELVSILKDDSINEFLFQTADKVRKKYIGNEVHLRGLIEFSNICKQNCLYCGLRKDNSKAKRARMTPKDIINYAKKAVEYGYKTVVLQSGEDSFFHTEKMCEIIKEIKSLNLALTLSIGEKTKEEYKAYKDAGADRYLLRIETTDKELYKKMHPKMSFENRVSCLKNLKELGFETGTGGLVGLPLQTDENLADDILFFKELDADMIGLGPFIPCPETPLGKQQGGSFIKALKVMSLTRLLLPDINIPATTAMETLVENGRILALQSGANVVMPNVTDGEFKKNYEIYPGKAGLNNTPEEYKRSITEKILSIGRTISDDYGFHKRIL
ncbi:MAG: [FeFe] hydrogenase H-cluster radical SAM maturase HydE [Clostridium sp.]|nr:[FeFe] hydrogenase H-cluster radical SAM maturase HydE [Clostridium sp.]